MEKLKALMVHAPTRGFYNDAAILGEALRWGCGAAEIHTLEIPWDPALDYTQPIELPAAIQARAPFDIVVLFQQLYGHPPLRDPAFARCRVFVPNIEWLMPQDEAELAAHPPDVVLYKNTFTQQMCATVPGFSRAGLSAVTGWSSCDAFEPSPRPSKDFRSFLHVRGVSHQKQASVLLSAWIANPDFPLLTIITSDSDELSVPSSAHNVEIVMRKLTTEELRTYQCSRGVHVYPSYAEGFGHALNEARMCESVLVTTDAPPMMELAETGKTGFRIPIVRTDAAPFRRSTKFPVRVEALSSTIREVLATPVSRLAAIGRCARESYLQDKERFFISLREVLRAAELTSERALRFG
jgi:glycosyltransferase involved in cell wall biosynthesis